MSELGLNKYIDIKISTITMSTQLPNCNLNLTNIGKYLPIDDKNLLFYSINKDEYEKNKSNIKKESLETLQTIKEQIEILRENGQLSLLAPKIYKFLQNSIDGIVYTNVEPILVTEDFRILIPKYNNLEIKLSHLTKSIYLLFLSSPEPIDLKDLHHHKDYKLA